MTTFKSLLLTLAMLLMLGQLNASGDKGKNPFSKKIQAALSKPDGQGKHLKENTATKVTVRFVVNETGDVTEACADTKDAKLKQHLQNRFLGLNLAGMAPCVTHSIDVSFVTY